MELTEAWEGCTYVAQPGSWWNSSSHSMGLTHDETWSAALYCLPYTEYWAGSSTSDSASEDSRHWTWSCACGQEDQYYHYSTYHESGGPVFTEDRWKWAYSWSQLEISCWSNHCDPFIEGCPTNSPSGGGTNGWLMTWDEFFGGDIASQTSVQQVQTNSTATLTYTLDNEYTDALLRDVILGMMPPYPTDWFDWGDIAYSVIDETHTGLGDNNVEGIAAIHKVDYHLGVALPANPDPNAIYTITWNEIELYLPDGEWRAYPHSETLSGTGDVLWTSDHEMIPPFNPHNCYCDLLWVFRFVADVNVRVSRQNDVPGTGGWAVADSAGCPSCARSSAALSPVLSAEFSLGQTLLARPLQSLSFSASLPSLALATPASLIFPTSDPATDVITNSAGLRQMKAPQTFFDVVTNSQFSYELRFYLPSQAGSPSGGLYYPSGSPFVTWRVENPDASTNLFNRLRLTEFRGSAIYTNDAVYTDSVGWTITGPGGLSQKQFSMVAYDTNTDTFAFTNATRIPGGADVLTTKRKYQKFPWGYGLIEETLSPASNPKTTTHTYYPGNSSHGPPLKQTVYPDGSWSWRDLDPQGRVDFLYRSANDFPAPGYSAPGSNSRESEYLYGDSAESYVPRSGDDGTISSNTLRCVIENMLGQEISRRYTVIPTNEFGYLRINIQAAARGGDWDDPNNLFTTNRYYSSGSNQGRLKSVVHPDGTLTTHDYADELYGNYRTNMTASGQPNYNFTAVVDGTTNWSVINLGGYPVLSITKDMASGIITAQEIYSSFDDFGRPGRVTHLNGTYEDTSYACCGVDTTTGRDGVTTQYLRDAAKRQTAQTRRGITSTNILDAASHTLKTIRIGTDASQIVQSQSSFNLAGELVKQTNALNGVTTYLETTDPTTGGLVRTNIYPDGGTRIEFYYLDGQLKKVLGTAASPMLYFYDIEGWGTTGDATDNARPYTLEIKLDASGGSNEWTKTYTDTFGRAYKTIYSDSTPTDLSDNPYEKSWFNNKGQLWKQQDPDGVTTLYTYNAKGEQEYSITALSSTALAITDYDSLISSLSTLKSGTDRITRTVSDVVHDSVLGADVRRTRTYAWTTDGADASVLTSTSESSTDGLHSWQISYGLTNESITVFGSSGYRYSTNIAPDRSYSVSISRYSTNVSSTHFDSINSQLSSINFGYDSHGRMNRTIDARNGGTTNWFNAMDQISSTKTPVPATGQSAQVTTNFFDNIGRVIATKLPDNTYVTNKFNLMGLLTNTFGSRTYPVSYSYDAQGRMKTMKTYKNFAANSGVATTTWNYDAYRGWLTNKVYDDSHGPSYTYTPAGRLLARIWARGVGTTNGYNVAGDLLSVSYSDATLG